MPVTLKPKAETPKTLPWEGPETGDWISADSKKSAAAMLRRMADELERPHLKMVVHPEMVRIDMLGPAIRRMRVDLQFE